jgi:hypothetical protein
MRASVGVYLLIAADQATGIDSVGENNISRPTAVIMQMIMQK